MEQLEYCIFCGKSEKQVERLLTNDIGICICNECVQECVSVLISSRTKPSFVDASREGAAQDHAYLMQKALATEVTIRRVKDIGKLLEKVLSGLKKHLSTFD